MDPKLIADMPPFLEALGLDPEADEPMGLFFTDEQPQEGHTPSAQKLPTRDKEERNEIDWQAVFGDFSCSISHIRSARRTKNPAWFSAEHFGCPGAAFWLGFLKPQTETIIHYVSSGIPNFSHGERYCATPDALRRIFLDIDPEPAPAKYCVIKPLTRFAEHETPLLVTFFTRPEPLCGLHQLAFFVTDDPEVVASPWAAGCGSIATWPLRYLKQGANRAVIGGWDISARKFFKPDELTFTVPFGMYQEMQARWQESFLTQKEWSVVQKKVARSRKAWE